jgi:hypothetical protein
MRLHTFLVARIRRFTAQIDDGGDAEFLKFDEIGKMRLCAAKKRLRNFSGVGNARQSDFCGERRRGRGGGGSKSRRFPKWEGRREEREKKSEEERKKAHRELARKSLGGMEGKKKEKGEKVARATVPQDIGV